MRRRILSIILALALSLALAIPALAAEDDERGTLKYEELIAPQYEDAKLLSEGLAAVKKDGKWGYINAANEVILPFTYDYANQFIEGHAVVGMYGRAVGWGEGGLQERDAIYLGVIDRSGNYKPLRTYQYNSDAGGYVLEDHFAILEYFDLNRNYTYYNGWVHILGLFDLNGNPFVTYDKYHEVYPRHVPTEGLVSAYMPGDYGAFYLDMNGEIALNLYKEHTYLDADGNVTSDWNETRYLRYISAAFPFNQGMALVYECTEDRSVDIDDDARFSYMFGFVDRSGNWVIPPQFDDRGFYVFDPFGRYQIFADNGLASVRLNGKFGAIDKTGRVVIPYQFDELWPFSEGLAAFLLGDAYGYVDSSGTIVIPAKYRAASGFNMGCSVVYDGSKVFLIDRYGNPVPGSDQLDYDTYFTVLADGRPIVYEASEYVVINVDGKYGFGRLSYLPPLPDRSEMDSWAYEEVILSIKNDLVPVFLQNQYRSSISRQEYCSLVIKAICTMLDTDAEALVQERTEKSLMSFLNTYPFSDTTERDVIAAYALGIVQGYEDGTFRPYGKITRQEAAVLLMGASKVLGFDIAGAPDVSFADSGQIANWAVAGVNFVYSINVMRGIDETNFSPLTAYQRQQSFITVYRILLALTGEE